MGIEENALVQGVNYCESSFGQSYRVATKQFQAGSCRVTLVRSGVGIVNAALAVMMICEYVSVDAILVSGVGGALSEELEIGDVVIASKIIQHDSFLSSESGRELIASGELTLSVPQEKRVDPVIYCDPNLNNWLIKGFENEGGKFKVGAILSGSEFVASSQRKQELSKLQEDACLVEMESAGIAQIAKKQKIPFTVIKTVADRAKPKNISTDYKDSLQAAAHRNSSVLRKILETL